jgi:hypothetical protein
MMVEQKETEMKTLASETDEAKCFFYQQPITSNQKRLINFVAVRMPFVGKLGMLIGYGKSDEEDVAALLHETP